jgi:5'-nucleotidase
MSARAVLITCGLVLLATTSLASSSSPEPIPWFTRILISNDDGIDNPRLKVLVDAFAPHCEVWVVAPLENRSGCSNYCSAFSRKVLSVEPRDLGPNVQAWGVDGYPTDCVILALTTFMKDSPPDLVLSGVNSSPNLADGWLASGTIGVVRTAAHRGYRAVAFSGLRENPPMMDAVGEWALRFCMSEMVRDMGELAYLTVSFPSVEPDEVAGVRLARRADTTYFNWFDPDGVDEQGREQWRLRYTRDLDRPDDTDQGLYNANFIAVTPMRVGEFDEEIYEAMKSDPMVLPDWSGPGR